VAIRVGIVSAKYHLETEIADTSAVVGSFTDLENQIYLALSKTVVYDVSTRKSVDVVPVSDLNYPVRNIHIVNQGKEKYGDNVYGGMLQVLFPPGLNKIAYNPKLGRGYIPYDDDHKIIVQYVYVIMGSIIILFMIILAIYIFVQNRKYKKKLIEVPYMGEKFYRFSKL